MISREKNKLRERGRTVSAERRSHLSRRELLRIVVGTAGAAIPLGGTESKAASACPAAPRTTTVRARYVPRFFSDPELRSLATLAETVIPADDHSPGAEAAGVHEFIDDMVADSDPKTKDLWRGGLAAIARTSEKEFGKSFQDLTANERTALLERYARCETKPHALEERFFVALKRMTIEGYYTSAVGIHQDLNYQGNTALAEFPGCTHADHK
jgi:glucoside 3-dehydrogenase (cytochrome c) hitch-hiker subunit